MAKKEFDPTLGMGVNQSGEYAAHQRRMKNYVAESSNRRREYVPNTAIPSGNGEWLYWTRPAGGGKARSEKVPHARVAKAKYES
jgi:hypothetical protein